MSEYAVTLLDRWSHTKIDQAICKNKAEARKKATQMVKDYKVPSDKIIIQKEDWKLIFSLMDENFEIMNICAVIHPPSQSLQRKNMFDIV